jgi:hypothetical protein
MIEEKSYTLDEAKRELKRRDCALGGHAPKGFADAIRRVLNHDGKALTPTPVSCSCGAYRYVPEPTES